MKKIIKKINIIIVSLLKFDQFRFYYCRIMWAIKKSQVRVYKGIHTDTGLKTISHNLSAFENKAVFGMSKRMGLLIYPTIAFFRNNLNAKFLIVGCRTDDDLLWLNGYGYRNVQGYDLISYSKNVILGDIHNCQLETSIYDVVMLGWMISYSKNPQLVIEQAKRILKDGGLLCIGLDYCNRVKRQQSESPAENELNSANDLIKLVNAEVVFFHEHNYSEGDNIATVFRIKK